MEILLRLLLLSRASRTSLSGGARVRFRPIGIVTFRKGMDGASALLVICEE